MPRYRLHIQDLALRIRPSLHPPILPTRQDRFGSDTTVFQDCPRAAVPASATELIDGTVGFAFVVSACGPPVVRCVAPCAGRPCGIRTCVPPSVMGVVRSELGPS